MFAEPNHLIICDGDDIRVGTLLSFRKSNTGRAVDIKWRPLGMRKPVELKNIPKRFVTHNIPRTDEEANLTIIWALHDGQSRLKEILTGEIQLHERDADRAYSEIARKESVLETEKRLFDEQKEEYLKKRKKQEDDLTSILNPKFGKSR